METKPWVAEAIHAGLTEHYRGLKQGDALAGASAVKAHVGDLAEYIAREIDKGVARALVSYGDFYMNGGQT